MDRLTIILNPHSGSGARGEADALRTAFAAVGTQIDVIPAAGAELQEIVRNFARDQPAALGIAGGDGTISSAATVLAGTGIALLPLPVGTMNHFAQRYGVPTVQAAVHAWQRRRAHAVPVGFLNDVAFINNASCGFYPHLVRHRERIERWLPRSAANWLAGLRVLITLPLMHAQLAAEGETRWLETPALWVGLGKHSLRLPQPGDVVREGDVLEIVVPNTRRRREIIALMTRTLFKLRQGAETPEDKALQVLHAAEFTLASAHRVDVGLDGEPFRFHPPLHFRYGKNALQVLCLVAPS